MTVKKSDDTLLVAGETTDAYDGAGDGRIEILSFSQEVFHQTRAAAFTTHSHLPVSVVKPLDESTPKLLEAAGKAFDGPGDLKVELVLVRQTGKAQSTGSIATWKRKVFYSLTLSRAFISRMEIVGDLQFHPRFSSGNSGLANMGPLEEIQFTFRKADWWYGTPQNGGTWTQPVQIGARGGGGG